MNNDISILEDITPQYNLATVGQRFGNYIVDFIIKMIVFTFISLTINSVADNHSLGTFIAYIFMFGYTIIMEFVYGQTIGKMLTKTMVISKDGHKLSLGQCFGRTFARIIPFEGFSVLGADAIMWHDSLTSTYVVEKGNTFVSI
jgi:uncharacterized RDD family membrane protein YckC